MSMEPIQATFMVSLLVGLVAAQIAGVSGWPIPYVAELVVAVAFAVLASAAHAYSPLTDLSGSPLSPRSVGGGYWGFSPPEDDVEKEQR